MNENIKNILDKYIKTNENISISDDGGVSAQSEINKIISIKKKILSKKYSQKELRRVILAIRDLEKAIILKTHNDM